MASTSLIESEFEPYRARVRSINNRISSGEDPKRIDGYVGYGSTSLVYRVGSEAVAKLHDPKNPTGYSPEDIINETVPALIRGLGSVGLEQLISFSRRDPAARVNRYIPGLTLLDTTVEQLNGITDSQFFLLVGVTFPDMQNRGLKLEPGAGNYIVNNAKGITVLDYDIDDIGQSVPDMALEFGGDDGLMAQISPIKYRTLPTFAYNYARVCSEVIGRQASAMLLEGWESQGFNLT